MKSLEEVGYRLVEISLPGTDLSKIERGELLQLAWATDAARIAHEKRVTELLEANNRYLEEARAARRVIAHLKVIDANAPDWETAGSRLSSALAEIETPDTVQKFRIGVGEVLMSSGLSEGLPCVYLAKPLGGPGEIGTHEAPREHPVPGSVQIILATGDGASNFLEKLRDAVITYEKFLEKEA